MDLGVPDPNVTVYGGDVQQYEGHYGADEGNYGSVDNIDDSAVIKHDSSSSAGKLFVGGIAWETSEEAFNTYFSRYGEVSDSVIMMDKISGRPRGFGFVTFADPEVADKVILQEHIIDGRTVEVKRTVPREDMQVRGVSRTKKIFVGGLPVLLTEDDMKEYFSAYGEVVEHQIMLDHDSGRSRGFGFVTFENEDAVDKIFADGRIHELNGKRVEIKRAEPKRSGFEQSNESRFRRGGSSRSSGSGSGGGKMGRDTNTNTGGYEGGYGSYGGYVGYGNYNGFYPTGYGGYGYGYGFGAPGMYGTGAYGGGAFGAQLGYGGAAAAAAAGYGVGKGYGAGGYDGGKGVSGGGGGGVYGGGGGDVGGYSNNRGYGNNSGTGGRFHPYRK